MAAVKAMNFSSAVFDSFTQRSARSKLANPPKSKITIAARVSPNSTSVIETISVPPKITHIVLILEFIFNFFRSVWFCFEGE